MRLSKSLFGNILSERKAQVWIETMIYTLIAFSIIALVLAVAKPKIEKFQDKALIEQSLGMMDEINSRILTSIQGGPGNKRVLDLLIKKGKLIVNSTNDKLIFEIESKYKYSEPGIDVAVGGVTARTEEKGKYNIVTLTKDYSDVLDLVVSNDRHTNKILSQAASPYSFSITNLGEEKTEVSVDSCSANPTTGKVTGCPEKGDNEFPDWLSGISYGVACLKIGSPATYTCKYKSTKIKMNIEVN